MQNHSFEDQGHRWIVFFPPIRLDLFGLQEVLYLLNECIYSHLRPDFHGILARWLLVLIKGIL